jgi:hypothetical protein
MTRRQILSGWLPDFRPAPDEGTRCRWLTRAVESGQVRRDGTGRRNDRFRYWLLQREQRWQQDPWQHTLEKLEAATTTSFGEGAKPEDDLTLLLVRRNEPRAK